MPIKVPRLRTNRVGVYCLRVYTYDSTGKLRETQHSLNTKNPQVARLLALEFNKSFEQIRAMKKPTLQDFQHLLHDKPSSRRYEIDLSRGVMRTDGTAEDHQRMMEALKIRKELEEAVNAAPSPSHREAKKVVQKSKKFSEIVELYLIERTLDNNDDTRLAKKRTYDQFQELFNDLEINEFTKQEFVAWKSTQIVEKLKPQTINSKLGELNGLFEWALHNGYYTASNEAPTKDLKITSNKTIVHESYEPFSNDDLTAIFSQEYKNKFNKPDYYFMPLIALFTGARREEIASLKTKNILTIDGVDSIEIEKGKNNSARRVVPIHEKLIEMGFLNYHSYMLELGNEFLFPHLIDGKNGRGKNVGRQFSDYLRKNLKISNGRKVFHSFRHTVITRLHTLNSNPVHALQIVGHNDESSDSVHIKVYTHDVGLQALKATINNLSYKLDFEGIKISDTKFKEFFKKHHEKERRAAMRQERTNAAEKIKENIGKPLFKGKLRTNF
ncbi:site-specific integrase [Comamonas sp.]|uniref:site-specific integrase n=1 Tax=Comamonas sp. TaxID=34028 RepID=UPI0028986303|nr:site-specific integrase [Comamonas sp.]